MTCGNASQTASGGPCGYTSARFEPFNILTVPLHVAGGPDDAHKTAKRLIVVHLVLQVTSTIFISIHINRINTRNLISVLLYYKYYLQLTSFSSFYYYLSPGATLRGVMCGARGQER